MRQFVILSFFILSSLSASSRCTNLLDFLLDGKNGSFSEKLLIASKIMIDHSYNVKDFESEFLKINAKLLNKIVFTSDYRELEVYLKLATEIEAMFRPKLKGFVGDFFETEAILKEVGVKLEEANRFRHQHDLSFNYFFEAYVLVVRSYVSIPYQSDRQRLLALSELIVNQLKSFSILYQIEDFSPIKKVERLNQSLPSFLAEPGDQISLSEHRSFLKNMRHSLLTRYNMAFNVKDKLNLLERIEDIDNTMKSLDAVKSISKE